VKFPWIKRTPIFKIRVVYKSGYTHEFEVFKFTYQPGTGYTWTEADEQNKAINIGGSEIAAVWQVGQRYKYF
jgi:hypothetical protein